MYYIHSIASISHQDSFNVSNVCSKLEKLGQESEVIAPNYKEYVPPASLRRLSPVLRMGLTASIECQNNTEKEFDAISVGTALGCLRDTEKFLVTFHTATSDFLSPTAFIQSTHNTIGGQISLGLKNHAYNMTHTQNNVSFEVALMDALMCIDEGKKQVLVGSADEQIPFLELMQPNLIPDNYPLTSGASFFVISPEASSASVCVQAVAVRFNPTDKTGEIEQFLANQQLTLNDIELALYADQLPVETNEKTETLNFLEYSGLHYSASAFAMHIAHDSLKHSDKRYALIINDMCSDKLGITLLSKQ